MQGRVKNQLFNRQGALDGVLLEDGTMVRMPPPEAERLAANLAVGQPIFVTGDGVTSVLGKVIAAHGIGPDKTHRHNWRFLLPTLEAGSVRIEGRRRPVARRVAQNLIGFSTFGIL